jgi:hypothetical protein
MLNDKNDDESNYYQYFFLILYSVEPWITMRFSPFSVSVSYTNILLLLLYRWKYLFCSFFFLLIFVPKVVYGYLSNGKE